MSLLCARMECGESAEASVQFDAEGSRVILIDLTERTFGIPVCRGHARTRTAPMGWTLTDQRSTPPIHQQVIWDAAADRPLQERVVHDVRPPEDPRFEWTRTVETVVRPSNVRVSSPLLSRAFRSVQ